MDRFLVLHGGGCACAQASVRGSDGVFSERSLAQLSGGQWRRASLVSAPRLMAHRMMDETCHPRTLRLESVFPIKACVGLPLFLQAVARGVVEPKPQSSVGELHL
jgi:hypothetical protein